MAILRRRHLRARQFVRNKRSGAIGEVLGVHGHKRKLAPAKPDRVVVRVRRPTLTRQGKRYNHSCCWLLADLEKVKPEDVPQNLWGIFSVGDEPER